MFESNKSCEESQEEMSGVETLSLSGKIAVDQRQEAKRHWVPERASCKLSGLNSLFQGVVSSS